MTSLIDRPLGPCLIESFDRSLGQAGGPFLRPRLPNNAPCPRPRRPQLQAGRKFRVVEAPAEILLPPRPPSREKSAIATANVLATSVWRLGGATAANGKRGYAATTGAGVLQVQYVTESIAVMCGD